MGPAKSHTAVPEYLSPLSGSFHSTSAKSRKSRKSQASWMCIISQPSTKLMPAAAIVPVVRFARENPAVNSRHVPIHGKTCEVECRLEDKACGLIMRGCLPATTGPGGSTFSSPHQEAASRSPAFGAVRRGPLLLTLVIRALNLAKSQLDSSSSHLTHRRIQGQLKHMHLCLV